MIPLTVTTNLDDSPWTDCKGIPELATITRVGRLPKGTQSGKSTVTLLIEFKDGSRAMAQTTLALFTASAVALKAAAEMSGEKSELDPLLGAIAATQAEFAAAFTEWERRYREEPERFMSETEKLQGSPETYGDACAPYLLQILAELRN